jgi:hypothetical protein
MLHRRLFISFLLILAHLASVTAGCGGAKTTHEAEHSFAMAGLDAMPAIVQEAPTSVQDGYQFAVANPDTLSQIPCYCGCGAMGHISNYDCYVSGEGNDGDIDFDNHALGCSICVDISQDVMRMMDQGKDVAEIFAYVDNTYARFGPPTPLAN